MPNLNLTVLPARIEILKGLTSEMPGICHIIKINAIIMQLSLIND